MVVEISCPHATWWTPIVLSLPVTWGGGKYL
jgi:hypothetical protein